MTGFLQDFAARSREHHRVFAELPIRVRHALESAGINSPAALAQKTLVDLQRAKNIGPKAIAEIVIFLAVRGLSLRTEGAPPRCLCNECPIHGVNK